MNIKPLICSLIFCLFFSSSSNAIIKVGTVLFDPPFVFSLNQGFDIQLMQQICTGMHEQCLLIPMDYNHLFQAINKGDIDLAIGGISIANNPSNQYFFSLPYMLSKGQFLVLKNSPIKSLNALKGQKVGVLKGNPEGGVFVTYLAKTYPQQFQVKEYDDVEDVLNALSNKEIAAGFLHRSSVLYWTQNGGGQFRTLARPTVIGSGIGILAGSKNAALIDQINLLLQKMETNSAYLDLYNTYFANE
ncbi:MAG: transporter substrate-binding domain-containing protein [bacterium]|nr:transporter substrate-binding domain-containing protein [bacterium]